MHSSLKFLQRAPIDYRKPINFTLNFGQSTLHEILMEQNLTKIIYSKQFCFLLKLRFYYSFFIVNLDLVQIRIKKTFLFEFIFCLTICTFQLLLVPYKFSTGPFLLGSGLEKEIGQDVSLLIKDHKNISIEST